MRLIILLLVLIVTISFNHAQIATMSTYAKTIVDTSTHKLYNIDKYKEYDDYQFIILDKRERTRIVKSLSSFIKDSTSYSTSILYPTNEIIPNCETLTTADKKKYCFENKSNYTIFLNDSILEEEEIYQLDPISGKESLPIITVKYSLIDNLIGINSLENWFLNNDQFLKETILSKINYAKYNDALDVFPKRLLSIKLTNKSLKSKDAFKENISYNYLFSPYKKLALHAPSSVEINLKEEKLIDLMKNNETKEVLLKNYNKLYDNTFNKYFKSSEKKYNNFAKSIFENIRNNKLKVYGIKSDKLIKKESIDSLFMDFRMQDKYNPETDEPAHDEFGDIILEIIGYSYKYNDIIGIHFNEDWYLAKNQFDIIKKVNSISFLVKNYDSGGDLHSEPKLLPFKIKFNN